MPTILPSSSKNVRNGNAVTSVNKNGYPSLPAQLRGKLLRLRKETSPGIPYSEIVRNFDQVIRPLFEPEELVDQIVVRLPRGLVRHCNDQLHIGEQTGARPRKRHGVYLSTREPLGLLVTDMTTYDDPGSILAELKPKWLLQSPSAPSNSRRCRTCALRDMKNHEARIIGTKEQRSFCPLDLVSDKFEDVVRATGFITGRKDQIRLARVLYQNNTLLKLQAHQKVMRDVGLNGPAVQSRERSIAMILRDCTMFVKLPFDERRPVEVRLGDLDLKTGDGGKAQYWRELETRLIREGWYAGIKGHSDCALGSRRLG